MQEGRQLAAAIGRSSLCQACLTVERTIGSSGVLPADFLLLLHLSLPAGRRRYKILRASRSS
jgi:hypothetical protein